MASPLPNEINNVLLCLSGDEPGEHLILEAGPAQELKEGMLTVWSEKPNVEWPLHAGLSSDLWRGKWKNPQGESVDVVGKTFTTRMVCIEQIGKGKHPLSHPYIQPILAYGYYALAIQGYRNAFTLVYPFAENGSLYQYITDPDRTVSLPPLNRLDLLIKIAQGVKYMHDRDPPIPHGVLKPGHILIDHNLDPRIVDFGLFDGNMNKLFRAYRQPRSSPTEDAYRPSPYEVENTLAGDVFSFAKLVFFVMTGERPKTWLEMKKSDEKTASERERGFKRTDYVGPLDDPQLWDLLEMWGNANPQNRPTMTEVVHDLLDFRHRRSKEMTTPNVPEATQESEEVIASSTDIE